LGSFNRGNLIAFTGARLPDALARQARHERTDKHHDLKESGCAKAVHARLRGVPAAPSKPRMPKPAIRLKASGLSQRLKSGQASFFSEPHLMKRQSILLHTPEVQFWCRSTDSLAHKESANEASDASCDCAAAASALAVRGRCPACGKTAIMKISTLTAVCGGDTMRKADLEVASRQRTQDHSQSEATITGDEAAVRFAAAYDAIGTSRRSAGGPKS
jgi:predicted RNA-binding Zn-ribbon protein involved in translation (DUF1610 family)